MGQGGLVDCLQEARTKRAMDLHRRANDDVGKVLVQNLCHTRSQPFVEFVAIPSGPPSCQFVEFVATPCPVLSVLFSCGTFPNWSRCWGGESIRNSHSRLKFRNPVQPRRS